VKVSRIGGLRKVRPVAHWQPALAVLVLAGIFWLVAAELSPRLSLAMAGLVVAVLAAVFVARWRQQNELTRLAVVAARAVNALG